jgi:hypothetical protein
MFGRPRSAAVEFSVANQARRAVDYRVGEREFTLEPRVIRTHRECGETELVVELPGEKPAKVPVRNRDQFAVVDDRGRLALRRAPHRVRRRSRCRVAGHDPVEPSTFASRRCHPLCRAGTRRHRMKVTTTIAIAVFAAPLAATAQTEVSRATIAGTPAVRIDMLHVCAERNDRLWDRSALLDRDKRGIDREGQDIARTKARLDEEQRRLDAANAAAVADYNARSATLNASVQAHNRQVADLNGAVQLLNSDSSELMAYCNRLYVGAR